MPEADTFPASYVKTLREESRRHRQERDEARRQLAAAREALRRIRLDAENGLKD